MKSITVTMDDKTYNMPAGRSVIDHEIAQFMFACRGACMPYQ